MTFLFNMILGIWSLIPTAAERAANKLDIDDMQGEAKMTGANDSDSNLEMKNVHKANTMPFTPRTLAFNTLDRQLPLRSDQVKNKAPRFA